jgi:hypothetical protein
MLHRQPRVSFEHAWFLLLALLKRDELRLATCQVCGRLFVRDVLGSLEPCCDRCAAVVDRGGQGKRRAPAASGRAAWPVVARTTR